MDVSRAMKPVLCVQLHKLPLALRLFLELVELLVFCGGHGRIAETEGGSAIGPVRKQELAAAGGRLVVEDSAVVVLYGKDWAVYENVAVFGDLAVFETPSVEGNWYTDGSAWI